MRVSLLVLLGVFSALVLGCGDETVYNTEVASPVGSIYGRIASAEPNTRVSAWQAAEIRSVVADDDGYFTLGDLTPGVYEIIIVAPSGAGRHLEGVTVQAYEGRSLGVIVLSSYPHPLFDYGPKAEEGPVPPHEVRISLSTTAALDVTSLASAVTFTPEIEGEWRESYYNPPFTEFYVYSFQPSEDLKLGETYQVHLDPSLRLEAGDPWGGTLDYSFAVEAFGVTDVFWRTFEGEEVPPLYQGSLVSIHFNADLDPASLALGVSVEPSFDVQIEVGPYNPSIIEVTADGGLKAGTTYIIHLTTDLLAEDGTPLPESRDLEFRTEPFRLTNQEVVADLDNVPPRAQNRTLIRNFYNLNLDPASIEEAVRITPPAPFRTSLEYSGTGFSVVLDGDLLPDALYTLEVGSELAASDGTPIGESRSTPFRTESLRIESARLTSSPYGGDSDTLLTPGGDLYARVYLNADVDPALFQNAASFEPVIQGVWVESESYYDTHMEFLMDGPLDLAPGALVVLRIDGSLPLVGEATLGEDYVVRATVAPVRVERFEPADGAINVPPYADIEVSFNVDMDRVSTEAAFRLERLSGESVPGMFSWWDDRRFSFRPFQQLEGGVVYRYQLTTAAMSASGHALAEGITSQFRTSIQWSSK